MGSAAAAIKASTDALQPVIARVNAAGAAGTMLQLAVSTALMALCRGYSCCIEPVPETTDNHRSHMRTRKMFFVHVFVVEIRTTLLQ